MLILDIGTFDPISHLYVEVEKSCYVFSYENYESPGAVSTETVFDGHRVVVLPGIGAMPDDFFVIAPLGWSIVGPGRITTPDDGSTSSITSCPLLLG